MQTAAQPPQPFEPDRKPLPEGTHKQHLTLVPLDTSKIKAGVYSQGVDFASDLTGALENMGIEAGFDRGKEETLAILTARTTRNEILAALEGLGLTSLLVGQDKIDAERLAGDKLN